MKGNDVPDLPAREMNYDLLRVLSCAAVVVLHVAASYRDAYFDPAFFGVRYDQHFLMSSFSLDIARFAVPCFVMLSGAFLLPSARGAEYRAFYRRSVRSVGVQALLFSFFYFLWSMLMALRAVQYKGKAWSWMWMPLLRWLRGEPYIHLWYLYMLLGVYLLAPFVVRFRQSVSDRCFSRAAWVFFLAATLSAWTSTHLLEWDLGVWFCWLGYFMIGDRLRVWAAGRKSSARGVGLIAAGVLVEAAMAWTHSMTLLDRMPVPFEWPPLFEPESPVIALASVLIFAGFSLLRVPQKARVLRRLAGRTFLIYLIHAAVWDVIASRVVRRYGFGWDNRFVIPLASAAVFAISCLLAVAYQWLWDRFDARFRFTDRLCAALRL